MSEEEYIKLAEKEAVGLLKSRKIDFYFTNYLCYVSLFVKAFVKKNIDKKVLEDDDLNVMITKEINSMITKFMEDDRDSQLASILYAITNETFQLEHSLLKSAFDDAIYAYGKYSDDDFARKNYVVSAAKADIAILFLAVKRVMEMDDGDELFERIHKRYYLRDFESKKIKKEITKDFDSFVIVEVNEKMKEAARCGQS